MSYLGATQQYPTTTGDPSGQGWVEAVIQDIGSWVAGLFGGQAEARDRERFAQNEEAFRRAAAGGEWDAQFLRARSGRHGTISIPVRLPYAVSPSSGDMETPGALGGWATGPAQRHAEALYAALLEGGPMPDPDPDTGEATVQLYTTARDYGRGAAEQLLQTLAAGLYGQIPQEYRDAIERGVRDHYAGQAGGTVQAALPWVLGAGVALAAFRRKR